MAADCEISSCGVTAIGRCRRCGLAFCTSHRAFGNDVTDSANWQKTLVDTCVTCYPQIAAERHAARPATAPKDRVAAHARTSPADIADPYERLVRVVRRLARENPSRSSLGNEQDWQYAWGTVPEIHDVVDPEERDLGARWQKTYASQPSMIRYPWPSQAVAAWFAASATDRGVPPNTSASWVTYRSILGRLTKSAGRPEAAWIVGHRPLSSGGAADRANRATTPVVILASGRYCVGDDYVRNKSYVRSSELYQLRNDDLAGMADVLDLDE